MMTQKKIILKNVFYGFIILLLSSCVQPESNSEQRPRMPTPETHIDSVDTSLKANQTLTTVAEIQETYAAVMKKHEAGNLDSTSFKYSCMDEKGGTVTYFSDRGQLRLVIHRYHEYDHYSAVDRYYVNKDRLYFAHLRGVSWSFEEGGGTRDNVKEQRLYVVNQRPVRCLEKEYTIKSNASDNPVPDAVSNNEVTCKSPASIIGPYQILLKYREQGTTGCLTP